MENYSPAVLRAAVKAAVQRATPQVTDSQATDITQRVIAADLPEITFDGGVRLASGEAMADALVRHKQAAPHLFDAPSGDVQNVADAVAKRAKLRSMKAADRLEAANADGGVTSAWARQFRKGGPQ